MAGIMIQDYLGLTPKPGHRVEGGGATGSICFQEARKSVASGHAFTVCYFGSQEFLPETLYVLAMNEFAGVNTLLLARLMGVDPQQPSLDWIGIRVKPRFLRNSKLKNPPTSTSSRPEPAFYVV